MRGLDDRLTKCGQLGGLAHKAGQIGRTWQIKQTALNKSNRKDFSQLGIRLTRICQQGRPLVEVAGQLSRTF